MSYIRQINREDAIKSFIWEVTIGFGSETIFAHANPACALITVEKLTALVNDEYIARCIMVDARVTYTRVQLQRPFTDWLDEQEAFGLFSVYPPKPQSGDMTFTVRLKSDALMLAFKLRFCDEYTLTITRCDYPGMQISHLERTN